ncbi:Rsp5p-dependent ubiquitination, sorting of cargo proteins at the multivesicular body [Mortierella claussenii]|nr:Rsp5p-dependent ubiquitination, sorting of cargo proteins at the multivesicular body [Mortierella claussenii]
MIVTAIRSCGLKASWLTGSSSSSSSASSSATLSGWHNGGGVGTSGSGGGAGGRARGGRGYAAHPVPTWEEDPNATEERLAALTDTERQAYDAAQAFQLVYPPNSVPTDISLSQYLSIQEKGVSAWEFEASYDHQLFVHDRTELSFYDQVACVQTNLPLPKQQEVYYWEVKMFEKSPNTIISVGVSTKPFPTTRLPGWNRHSVGYFSNNGQKYCNSLWSGYPYGPIYFEGDVIGCGYRPRNGTIFFTRNGRRIEDAYTGFGRTNLFPTVGATGPCVLHVNFGQSGFVFVEANVKKWGLAPASGSLAPPPAYGKEVGSILLEASGIMPAGMDGSAGDERERGGEGASRPRPILQSSSSRTQLLNGQPPGGHDGRSSPVQISEANMSAPPPNYSSLDRYGHPRPVGQGNVDGQQRHPSQDNGAAADDDSISIASTDSDESATLLLGNARPQLEDDYDDSGPHGANGGGGS